MLRFVLKRQSGSVGVTDLLVVVLIADAAQNAMAGDYKSVPDGIMLVSIIVFWSFVIDWLGGRFPALGRLIHPPPLPLVLDGKMVRRNMRKELITEEELMSQLREQARTSSAGEVCLRGGGRANQRHPLRRQGAPPFDGAFDLTPPSVRTQGLA